MTRGENDHTAVAILKPAEEAQAKATGKAGKRIAAYQLTDYLERLGVEVIFGLCGHTVIAFLDALGKSRIRFISTRHEQVAAPPTGTRAHPGSRACC